MSPPGLVLGLTGGIATGKTTVANLLHDKGALIIDADQVSRDLMVPGSSVFQQLVERFGPGFLTEQGELDRTALGAHVFGNPEALQALNGITHPAIWEELKRRVEAGRSTHEVVVLMAPLLIEHDHQHAVDQVWLITVPDDVQVGRLQARNGLTKDEARARLAAQLPTAAKLKHAHVVIDNGGTLEETRRQIDEAWSGLESRV